RFEITTNLKIIREVPTMKNGDDVVSLRDQATYRLDFLQADTIAVTTSTEDDPTQAFAILAASIESPWVDIKNLELKLDAACSLILTLQRRNPKTSVTISRKNSPPASTGPRARSTPKMRPSTRR